MEAIKKIDVHAHAHAFQQFIPPMTRGPKLISPEELISWYDRLNIEFGILVILVECILTAAESLMVASARNVKIIVSC